MVKLRPNRRVSVPKPKSSTHRMSTRDSSLQLLPKHEASKIQIPFRILCLRAQCSDTSSTSTDSLANSDILRLDRSLLWARAAPGGIKVPILIDSLTRPTFQFPHRCHPLHDAGLVGRAQEVVLGLGPRRSLGIQSGISCYYYF